MDVFSQTMERARGYLREAASQAARELGLFDVLPRPREALAASLGVKPRRLEALVRALLLEGVLCEAGGALHASAAAPARPVPREGWGRLAEAIRSDRPIAPGETAELLRRFHDHLRSAGEEAAREVAARIGPRGPLLDLGGGAGAYAAAFLEAHPGERAIVVDRPQVVELARAGAPGAELVALDLLGADPWPSAARVALLANVLHLFGPVDAAALVARAASSVVPGGRVAVKDFLADSAAGILFSLNMALFTDSGEVHPLDAVSGFLRAAGLRDVRAEPLRCAPDCVLVLGTAP